MSQQCRGPLLEDVSKWAALPQWVLSSDGKSVSRKLVAKNWSAALTFVNAVSKVAEAANHHPDIHVTQWRQVELVLSTHSMGGLTQQDLDLAAIIDGLPVEYSPKWLRDEQAFEEDIDEPEAAFNREHFANGLNGDFLGEIDVETFAGDEGKFEDPERRDIARAKDTIVKTMEDHAGLGPGCVVADIGSGTGLLLEGLVNAVGPTGKVVAQEISPGFRTVLQDRFGGTVDVIAGDEKNPNLDVTSVDVALLADVYHHLLYPRTVVRNIRKALKPTGALVVIDFHRDHRRITSHDDPDWVYHHVRADQATFTAEIESSGFRQIADINVPGLPENYFLVFRKRPIPSAQPPPSSS